ncbi:uncharacterized protein F4822DRAFT_183178 [Hypoxylon trugodes]|uniref:uncharacterized protein n=1 Tax=Hypoxylon trugodes TaxID=326681 RepID=UPI0021945ED0|nr:uncharacterized protein F4822DRAFT_183178 [Hypoxylon trugodes]KAI1391359.1 hypothetical protein F4822DRAFT_183178 [Hypoxylon trugodes]
MEQQTDGAIQLSFPLPRSLDTKIHLRLTIKSKNITLFLTTRSADEENQPCSMGSFIYALPDKYNPDQPLSTTIYSREDTLELTTRLAKILAKKTQMPVYVGNSISFANTGLGGTVEEEMEAFKKVVEVTLSKLQDVIKSPPGALPNGTGSS